MIYIYIQNYIKFYLNENNPNNDYLIMLYKNNIKSGKLPHISNLYQLEHLIDVLPDWFVPCKDIIPNMIENEHKIHIGHNQYRFMQQNRTTIKAICANYPKQ